MHNSIEDYFFSVWVASAVDGIKLYRLEGDVRLPERGGISLFNYWKPLLTDWFIETIKEKGGVLLNLASNEMQDLFDWARVSEVRVITPDFQGVERWKVGFDSGLCQNVQGRDGPHGH